MCKNYLFYKNSDKNSLYESDESDDNKEEQYYVGTISFDYTTKNRLILEPKNCIDYRYEIIDNLGKGAFSDVYKCLDHKTKNFVALKVIKNEKKYHDCAYKENRLFEKIMESNKTSINLINLQRSFIFNSDIFFVFDLFGISLYNYIKNNDTKKY